MKLKRSTTVVNVVNQQRHFPPLTCRSRFLVEDMYRAQSIFYDSVITVAVLFLTLTGTILFRDVIRYVFLQ
jgi:hypothetical protein